MGLHPPPQPPTNLPTPYCLIYFVKALKPNNMGQDDQIRRTVRDIAQYEKPETFIFCKIPVYC